MDKESSSKEMLEVEYSYIDFTWMIIGQKIKNAGNKMLKFNDLFYSNLLNFEDTNAKLSLFGESSVINIIDS